MKAIVIQPDGSHRVIEYAPSQSYNTLKMEIGGWLEAVTSTGGSITFWCDEEGKLKGRELNHIATGLWWNLAQEMIEEDHLVGPVVITGGADPEGETLGLSDEQVALVESYIKLTRGD